MSSARYSRHSGGPTGCELRRSGAAPRWTQEWRSHLHLAQSAGHGSCTRSHHRAAEPSAGRPLSHGAESTRQVSELALIIREVLDVARTARQVAKLVREEASAY